MIDEVAGQAGEVLRTCQAAIELQSALDELAGTGADHVARGVKRHGRQALAFENEVERVDQVGRRVDKRAVEIEYDSFGRGHLGRGHGKALSVGAQSCKLGW